MQAVRCLQAAGSDASALACREDLLCSGHEHGMALPNDVHEVGAHRLHVCADRLQHVRQQLLWPRLGDVLLLLRWSGGCVLLWSVLLGRRRGSTGGPGRRHHAR